jgi:hypothetical protein
VASIPREHARSAAEENKSVTAEILATSAGSAAHGVATGPSRVGKGSSQLRVRAGRRRSSMLTPMIPIQATIAGGLRLVQVPENLRRCRITWVGPTSSTASALHTPPKESRHASPSCHMDLHLTSPFFVTSDHILNHTTRRLQSWGAATGCMMVTKVSICSNTGA